MVKITFLGAGSSVFAKNVLGDILLTPELKDIEISLHDIDEERLEDSRSMILNIAKNTNRTDVKVFATTNRKKSLQGAKYIINAVQIGGYDPCTITDFEIPKKFGLRQTIGDTLGIGGIFRALRTIPIMDSFAKDVEEVCPDALFLNYTNPMSILTGWMQRYTKVNTIGLCHSVQQCIPKLFKTFKMENLIDKCKWEIAGINHQAWLLKVEDLEGNDLYPEIKRRSMDESTEYDKDWDLVRLDIMKNFGYYVTESSEHNAEYTPWYIKEKYPELIDRFKIPLDEYPRRCIRQINRWKSMKEELVNNSNLVHEKSHEYAASIIKAIETDIPYRIHANVQNTGLITNLPTNACVEIPCMIDRNGVNPCFVGDLPEQCAAINRTNINVHLLTLQAARSHKKEDLYMAAMLDPHTASELSIDDIKRMCDELLEAHKDWIPVYR